jgi:hypothetical protein
MRALSPESEEIRGCDIVGCAKAHYGRGYCRTHWERNLKHGDPLKVLELHGVSDEERLRFWSEQSGDCIVWTGGINHRGYGQAWSGENGEYTSAHRLSYTVHNGPIPDGMLVRHTCDNRPCINPKHLIVGTHVDNMNDMVERDRSLKGELNPATRLTDKDVRSIRAARSAGETLASIAARFGIGASTVARIATYKSWSHVA